MEKYCPKCGKVYRGKEADAKVCMYCAIPLKEREGRIPLSQGLRDQVLKRDGYRCVKCGASNKDKRLEVDHIIPVAKGGTNDINNLRTLCWECNRDEGAIVPNLGLKYDIEIKENELKTLKRLLQENKNKLNAASSETEEIEFKYNIIQLEKDIYSVNTELNELKIKYQEEQEAIRLSNEDSERKEFLFKKLVVKLSPVEKLILKDHYGLNRLSDEAMLRTIIEDYSENEILKAIEDYKTDLRQYLDKTITFNMLHLISSELSINDSSSKTDIINHIINNCTKSQTDDLINKVKNELFNQYAASFNNIEKSILKHHYSLDNISDTKLVNYVIENDYSIDDLKNTVRLSYKSIFQEYYNPLDEYQKYLVVVRFENHGNNLVDFLAKNNFSSQLLKEDLKKTKIDLFNKTLNSLNYNKKSLIERYSLNHTTSFDLIDYFYKNRFSNDKIEELIELSKQDLCNDVHQDLNNHEMFLFENTFETDYSFINFMIEHEYSMKSLRKRLKRTQKTMIKEINQTLDEKQKFLLKKYFSKDNDVDLINYLVTHEYNLEKTLEIANKYKKELYDEFDNNLNYDYEKILYNCFSLKTNSKDELIDYLIYEDYNVQSMDNLIIDTVFLNFNKLFNKYSVSHVCYKLNMPSDKADLYEYLFRNRYTIYSTKQLIKQSEKDLIETLKEKLDFRSVELINKDLNLPNSKNNLISYLMENYTVDSMRGLLRKYDIKL